MWVGECWPGRGRESEIEFDDFFRGEYPRLVRSLYLLTADLPEAEELAQESMARAYERWGRVRRMDAPGGYVYRTAVNLNRKRVRHLAVRVKRIGTVSAGLENTEQTQSGAV